MWLVGPGVKAFFLGRIGLAPGGGQANYPLGVRGRSCRPILVFILGLHPRPRFVIPAGGLFTGAVPQTPLMLAAGCSGLRPGLVGVAVGPWVICSACGCRCVVPVGPGAKLLLTCRKYWPLPGGHGQYSLPLWVSIACAGPCCKASRTRAYYFIIMISIY